MINAHLNLGSHLAQLNAIKTLIRNLMQCFVVGQFQLVIHFPDQRDKYYKTPLMAACRQGNVQMSRFLISLGADVNAKDNFFWTPLHFACNSGQLPIVQMLVDAGASINAQTMHKATPLMRAVETSRIEVVEFLLEKGEMINL